MSSFQIFSSENGVTLTNLETREKIARAGNLEQLHTESEKIGPRVGCESASQSGTTG